MTNAENLRRLAEEMAGAYEERAHLLSHIKQGNNELRQETGDLLSGFSKDRKEMGNELKSELNEMKSQLIRANADLKNETAHMLSGFHTSHKEMGNALKSELNKKKGDLKQESTDLLHGFHTSREEMGNELKSQLKELTSALGRANVEFKQKTANMLNEFRASNKDMRKELKSELTGVTTRRKHETADLLSGFHASREEMSHEIKSQLNELKSQLTNTNAEFKQETAHMLNEFQKSHKETAKEIAGTKKAWNELLLKMRAVRGSGIKGKPIEVDTSREKKQDEDSIEEQQMAKEDLKQPFSDEEESHKKGELEDRILEVVTNNQGGLKMVDIADNLGIQNWRSLIPTVRELLDDGKLRKSEDSLYYI
ncbi:MAG: hypothetical protein SVY10_16840 [Thermodesulfobacteriota bacterium]|nr:hypothetical protein [Thermodesulfobacteriota bacterium]